MTKRYHKVRTHSDEGAGIEIRRDADTETISIAGWYDGCMGSIEAASMSTRDFLKLLGFRGAILDMAAPKTY